MNEEKKQTLKEQLSSSIADETADADNTTRKPYRYRFTKVHYPHNLSQSAPNNPKIKVDSPKSKLKLHSPKQQLRFTSNEAPIASNSSKNSISVKRKLNFECSATESTNHHEQPFEQKAVRYQYRRFRFRTASEHWRLDGRQEPVNSSKSERKPSKLKFEEDRESKFSRLLFEKDNSGSGGGGGGKGGNSPLHSSRPLNQQTKFKWGGSTFLKGETERSMDELADQSENEGIQSANLNRKISTSGIGKGWRTGRYWRSGHDSRVEKREVKRATRETKDKAYELRHGKPSKSAQLRKKLMIRKRQVENYAEKKLGKKTAERSGRFLAFVARKAIQVIRLAVAYVASPALGLLAIYAAIAVIILMMFNAFMNNSVAVISSYTAPNTEIEAASSYYSRLEAELDKEIKDIPTEWKWQYIDQFHYDLDPIGHDPYQLMAYLSVKYPGFKFNEVKTELDYIFDKRYTLKTHQWHEWRGERPHRHKYYHLDVTLRSKPLKSLLLQELAKDTENDLVSWYDVLMETKGAHQSYANPFDIDWSSNVSSLYGYRVDPIGNRELQQHRGLDIAMPTGTPIIAGLSGTVRYVGTDAVMGNYIILAADGKDNTMKYGHCDDINLSAGDEVIAGETVIGTVGNTGQSTGAHLHVEILENGEYVNPIYSLDYKVKTAKDVTT
ncbi:MAG: M23 family metallopeptidase [Candidatus Fimivivens sp.]